MHGTYLSRLFVYFAEFTVVLGLQCQVDLELLSRLTTENVLELLEMTLDSGNQLEDACWKMLEANGVMLKHRRRICCILISSSTHVKFTIGNPIVLYCMTQVTAM